MMAVIFFMLNKVKDVGTMGENTAQDAEFSHHIVLDNCDAIVLQT